MIRHERPGKAFRGTFRQKIGKAGNKTFFVCVIDEDVAAFDPANNDVLQNVRYVKARLTWHELKLTFIPEQDNSELASNVPLPPLPHRPQCQEYIVILQFSSRSYVNFLLSKSNIKSFDVRRSSNSNGRLVSLI